MTATNNNKSRWTEKYNRKMTNYTEHDDATIKIIGVKVLWNRDHAIRIVHMMMCVLPAYKLDMNRPVETYWQTVDEVKRLSLLNWTGIWRCLKPHAESPSHRFCGYGSTPLFFLRRTSHEGSIWVRFSGHWKPSLNDDQPKSCLALTGKVGTRTTSMELPNELA